MDNPASESARGAHVAQYHQSLQIGLSMFGVLVVPQFHLQARLRHERDLADQPVALLGHLGEGSKPDHPGNKHRILEASQAALERGIELGMTPPQAQARCPEISLLTRSRSLEDSTQEAILHWAESISPRIESTDPGVCTIDLSGTRYSQGGEYRFGQAGLNALEQMHLRAQAGVAAHPQLAQLAARFARPIQVLPADPVRVRQFLTPLPVEALPIASKTATLLKRWGVSTFGELLELPQQATVERLGDEIRRLWELLTLAEPPPLKRYQPIRDLSEGIDFEHPIDRLETLLRHLRSLLEQLSQRLKAIYQVTGAMTLQLRFEDESTHEQHFEIPDPTRDPRLLLRLLHTSLESFRSESPIIGVSLSAQPARPPAQQLDFFRNGLQDPNRFAETVARVKALVGSDHVGTPYLEPTHRPDAFRMVSFREPTEEKKGFFHAPDTAQGLPLRRFRPPIPVSISGSLSNPKQRCLIKSRTIQGRLTYITGPWKRSGNWWDPQTWAREEWDIELAHGGLYRLVHDGHDWKLEGMYG